MRKFVTLILISSFVLSSIKSFATPGDTTWVYANNVHLNYYNNFDTAVVFPNQSKTYRKILMYFTLGKYACPTGTEYCHQWDYTVQNYLLTSTDTVELCRFITPFATSGWARFNGNWKQPYVFDVTNFAPLLHDSATVRIHYSGYSGGFTANVKFAFIEGTPARTVLGVQKVYNGSFAYGDTASPINTHFPQMTYITPAGTQSASLKVLVTGHGSDVNQCCEFQSHNYQLLLNGGQIADHAIWKNNCGSNELYPQGGSWPYNRGNWCPGEKVLPILDTLTGIHSGGESYNLQMKFDNYQMTDTTSSFGSYTTSATVFYYGGFNKTLDASLDAIISPNESPIYFRQNPSGTKPKVVVKNTGSTPITSIKFQYGVKDSTTREYTWAGTINPLQKETIELDSLASLKYMSYDSLSGQYQFNVKILEVNNQADDDSTNNHLNSQFVVAPTWPGNLILTLKTANIISSGGNLYLGNPNQQWTITDMNGNVVYSRTSTNADTKYVDTISIGTSGLYKLTVTTNNGFGLHTWMFDGNSQIHQGYFKLQDFSGALIPMKDYYYSTTQHDDWGNYYTQYFSVSKPGWPLDIKNVKSKNNSIKVFPNPAKGNVNIALNGFSGSGTISIINMMGQVVYSKTTNENHLTINTSGLAEGIYNVLYKNNDNLITKRLIIE